MTLKVSQCFLLQKNAAEKLESKFESVLLASVSYLVAGQGNEGFYHQQHLPFLKLHLN